MPEKFNPKDWSYTYVGKNLLCDITGTVCFVKREGCTKDCAKINEVK